MGSLTALLLATPIFGFSLQGPGPQASVDLSAKLVVTKVAVAELAAKRDAAKDDDSEDDDSEDEGGGGSDAEYKQELKLRNNIAGVHRIFGLASWAAMTVTIAAGVIDYYNLYGFGADLGSNPCVKGSAVFGDDFGCRGGIRTIKSAAAYVTTGLYATTFALSLLMPDPDDLASGKGDFASTLRLHKTLRWVHFIGMLAQIGLGVVIASRVGGLDRANDYDALQTFASIHVATGLITWGAMTWAGALMTF